MGGALGAAKSGRRRMRRARPLPKHQGGGRGGRDGSGAAAEEQLLVPAVSRARRVAYYRRRYGGAALLFFLGIICVVKFGFTPEPAVKARAGDDGEPPFAHLSHMRRELLAKKGNTSDDGPLAMLESCGYETDNVPVLWVLLYSFAVFNLFLGIAILCDDYFVPSLEAITDYLGLSPDVAGATFMAAGSSAPELFTSLAGVAMDHAEVGAGTIIGSAVFNILVIIALSCAFAKEELQVEWRCFFRDGLFYSLSIVLFIICSFDSKFYWWEGLILIILYSFYILLMKYNQKLMLMLGKPQEGSSKNQVAPDTSGVNITVSKTPSAASISYSPNLGDGSGRTSSAPDRPSSPAVIAEELKQPLPSQVDAVASGKSSLAAKKSAGLSNSEPNLAAVGADGKPTSAKSKKFHHIAGDISSHFGGDIHIHTLEHGHGHGHGHSHHSLPGSRPHSRPHSGRSKGKGKAERGDESDDTMENSPAGDSGSDDEDEHRCDHSCGFRCCIPCHPRYHPGPEEGEEDTRGCLAKTWDWFMYVMAAPHIWMFTNTIPHEERHLVWSFVANVVWIAAQSYVMVVAVTRIGCIIGIDQFTMGLVIIAAGTSVPDALSSIIATKDGFADMSVSNAIGSNVFDICLGIGIPYLIKALVDGEPIKLVADDGRKEGDQYIKFGAILLAILVLTIICFTVSKWKLKKGLGIGFLALYVCFITYALIQSIHCDEGRDC